MGDVFVIFIGIICDFLSFIDRKVINYSRSYFWDLVCWFNIVRDFMWLFM